MPSRKPNPHAVNIKPFRIDGGDWILVIGSHDAGYEAHWTKNHSWSAFAVRMTFPSLQEAERYLLDNEVKMMKAPVEDRRGQHDSQGPPQKSG